MNSISNDILPRPAGGREMESGGGGSSGLARELRKTVDVSSRIIPGNQIPARETPGFEGLRRRR